MAVEVGQRFFIDRLGVRVLSKKTNKNQELRVSGYAPIGISYQGALTIGRKVGEALASGGANATVRALSFLPSTLTVLSPDRFQVMANTTVQFNDGGAPRNEAVDSVITVKTSGTHTKFETVRIPLLED
jgi:hypothetical protein